MRNVIQLLVKENEDFDELKAGLEGYGLSVIFTNDITEVFHMAIHSNPDILIIDDSITGKVDDLIRIFKKTPQLSQIEIILVLDEFDNEVINNYIYSGASDIIIRPFNREMLYLRINSLLKSASCYEAFDEMILSHTQELSEVQSVMIEGLASIAEYHDPETGGHIKRTQNYVKALAIAIRDRGLHVSELTDENIELMYMSVPLHDIGKVGIGDNILLKPGKLTKEEFEHMKLHTVLGHEAIKNTKEKLDNNMFLNYADSVAYTHQEKWDGSGYPRNLKGEDIPLIGRIMAVADVYDALVNKRVYKEAFSHEKAVRIIVEGRGSHFDPEIVDVFYEINNTFRNIAITYMDTEEHDDGKELLNIIGDGIIKKVLVLDDSKVIRSIVTNQLEAMGCKVICAENGLVGLEFLKYHEFDLILTDLVMPFMDGYEFTKQVRKDFSKEVIILAITASDYELTKEGAKEIGLDGVLLKPLDIRRFEKKIIELLNARES